MPIPGGLINQTFLVRSGGSNAAVLQRLNTDIFIPEVHDDIEAVTAHLADLKLATPRLRRTAVGCLWHSDASGSVWRCMGYEGDRTVHRIESVSDAWEAACLVARFHAALRRFDWEFRSVRKDAHNTALHMEYLVAALRDYPSHTLSREVARVADAILDQWDQCSGRRIALCGELPRRIVHGDLKISNVRYTGSRAHCLIDLDTLAIGTFDLDFGDALRSWCCLSTENDSDAVFDLDAFSAALDGYHAGSVLFGDCEAPSEAEWEALIPGIERIALELAARFARDALEEKYFGWDSSRGSRGEHCLMRARCQLSLAKSIRAVTTHAHRALQLARMRRYSKTV